MSAGVTAAAGGGGAADERGDAAAHLSNMSLGEPGVGLAGPGGYRSPRHSML